MNNGLIVYSFKKKQPDEVPVPMPAPETEKDDNYVYVPQYQPAQEILMFGFDCKIQCFTSAVRIRFFTDWCDYSSCFIYFRRNFIIVGPNIR